MTVDRVLIEVHPVSWRAFCQSARAQHLETAVALGRLVEEHVLAEHRALMAARQRAFRAKQRAARDA